MTRDSYGGDLHLWPVKPEVSPLREEELVPLEEAMAGLTPDPNDPADIDAEIEAELRAVARSTDPGTSWEAARSITPEKLRESQREVLDILRRHGPMTDDALLHMALMKTPTFHSPSGIRTRRSELVAMGLVRDSGRKDVLRSGRRAIVWEAVATYEGPDDV